jgi:hypothetical protein
MLFIMMMILNIMFSHSLAAAEVVQVFDHPIKMGEIIDDKYANLLENGEIIICNKNNEIISRINRNASLIKVIDKSKLAVISGENILLYNANDFNKPNPQPYHTIKTTGLTVSAIASQGDYIYFGTSTGSIHKVRINGTTINFIPGACKTEIKALAIKNDMMVVLSLAEHSKLIDLKRGFMEGILVSSTDSNNVLNPVRAIAFDPGYWSMNVAVAQGNEILIYDASANGDSSIKRQPQKKYDLGAPVLTVSYNGRFIWAGLFTGTAKVIDTGRTDNKGNHIILTRTGYTAGSVVSLMTYPGGAIMLAAGRNVYVEASSGAGKLTLVNTTDLKTTRWITLKLKYQDEYNTEIKQEFRFPDYNGSNAWVVPEGTAFVSTTDSNVVIEDETLTIDGAAPVSVRLRIIESEEPEKPRPIVVKVPDLPLIPADFIDYTEKYLVSIHSEKQLMLSEKKSCRVIPLSEIPYLARTDRGKVLAAFSNELAVYSCSNGGTLFKIPFADKARLAYHNDIIAAATAATVTVFARDKISAKISLENEITGIDLSGDGKLLLIATGRMIRMFEAQAGTEIPLHAALRRTQIHQIAYSLPAHEYPSARFFIVYSKEDGIARLHDAISGIELKEYNLGRNVNSLRFDGNDRLIIHDTVKNTVSCINLSSGTNLYKVDIEGSAFAILPREETVAFVNKSGQIVLRKKGDDSVIGLTEKNAWYFARGNFPVLFQASEILVPFFTTDDGRALSHEEIKLYRTAVLPLP